MSRPFVVEGVDANRYCRYMFQNCLLLHYDEFTCLLSDTILESSAKAVLHDDVKFVEAIILENAVVLGSVRIF